MEKKLTWQVTENNGGGLTLYVWDDDNLIYAHAGYEYVPASLREDIQALRNGNHPISDGWDGNDLIDAEIVTACRTDYGEWGNPVGQIFDDNNEIIPLTHDEYYDDHETTLVIAAHDYINDSVDMGRAGQSVFYPDVV